MFRKELEANNKTKKKLATAITMAHIVNPIIAIGFIIIYSEI